MEKKQERRQGVEGVEICCFNQDGQKGDIWVDVIKMRK